MQLCQGAFQRLGTTFQLNSCIRREDEAIYIIVANLSLYRAYLAQFAL